MRKHDDVTQLIKSAAALTAVRQGSAMTFVAATLALPRVASKSTVDGFIWAYFSALFLSSFLDFGLERLAVQVVAARDGRPLTRSMSPLMLARLVSLPISPIALAGLLAIVRAHLPAVAWVSTVVWITALQVQALALAGMRTAGRHDTEVRVAALTRPAQAVFLLALAVAGASLSTLVAVVAFVDLLAAAAITRSIGSNWEATWREMAVLPSRALGAHMVVQLLALAYLRADAVLVGRLLGQGAGATYNLIYRVVDGLLGLATPGLLLFFPFAARRLTRGQRVDSVRRHAWSLVPVLGASLALAAQWSAGGVAHFIPRFREGLSALRILVVSVPLYYVTAAELYLRAAEGRNREVFLAGISTLALNVALNIVLIPRNGLEGAAWALVVTEAAQLTVLSYSNFGSSNLRFSLAPLGMTAALAVNALLLHGRVVAGSTIVSLLLALSLIQLLRRGLGSLPTSVIGSASRFLSKGVPRQPIDQGWLSGSTS